MSLGGVFDLAGGLKKVSSVSGGEFAGPCPWCGGNDRFRCWPDHPSGATGGRFLCRGCGRQGDGIAFLRELEGLSYRDACRWLGAEPKGRTGQARQNVRGVSVWAPGASTLPGSLWSTAAEKFVAYAEAQMAANETGRAYAASRGLTVATVAALRIGWNPSDLYQDREAWGLPPEVNERTGKPRKVWLPAGLVVPTIREGSVVSVKIRRSGWSPEDELPKYAAVSGSAKAPMILAGSQGKPVVIVESELDAVLVAQAARDLVAAIAMRTAKAKPDAEAHKLLLAAPVVLVATDADEAGATAFPWWREHYNQAVRWPVPGEGKDVGDLAAKPGLIRAWVQAGLPEAEPEVEPKVVQLAPVTEPSLVAGPPTPAPPGVDPCPYPEAQIAAFAISHSHLRCCPRTRPAWNWREVAYCTARCNYKNDCIAVR